MMKKLFASLTLAALTTLAACGNGGGGGNVPQLVKGTGPATAPTPIGGPVLIGMGDSLTAGEQSDGLLGTLATSPLSAYPGNAVYPGQDSGWFAILFDCLTSTGGTCNHTSYSTTNASLAILPLINAPGLGTQIVLNATTLLANTQSGCSAFNTAAFGASTWEGTRISPTTGIADLGVPGITMHEAVAMTGPYEGPPGGTNCGYTTIPGDPTSGGLQSLVESENQLFLPVLGEFAPAYGSNLTMLNVATGMSPKLTTVWLGANDLLKYIFSAGTAPASDTPTQMAADLTKIIKSLTATGSKVLVADLPTLLPTTGHSVPQFFAQANLTANFTKLLEVESGGAIGPGPAAEYAAAIVADLGTNFGVTAGGYLTESGFLGTIEQAVPLIEANPADPDFAAIQLDPTTKGSGLGSAYLTPAFVAQVQALNAAYNQAIDGVATSSGSNVALVPISTFFNTASTTGIPVGPFTVTEQFGGGLTTWDGLHPSNVGYAVIANDFIATADTAFGMTIPQLSTAQLEGILGTDPYYGTGIDPAVFPLQ
jgi:lysophospholipase L1-like esterase